MPAVGPGPNSKFQEGKGEMCGWKAEGEAVVQFSFTRLAEEADEEGQTCVRMLGYILESKNSVL